MFDSPILELVIGLVVVYLLFSLIASAINEALASIFKSRAAVLEAGIRGLLNDPKHEAAIDWCGRMARKGFKNLGALFRIKPAPEKAPTGPADQFFAHARIQALGAGPGCKPSYINKNTFSTVLLDMIAPQSGPSGPAWKLSAVHAALLPEDVESSAPPSPPSPSPLTADPLQLRSNATLRGALANLYRSALTPRVPTERLALFQSGIEGWFDECMDRASGWYKRWAQLRIFCVAVILTVGLNVDSVALVRSLYQNPGMRQAISSQAGGIVKIAAATPSKGTDEPAAVLNNQIIEAKNALKQLDAFNLPLGWTSESPKKPQGSVSGFEEISKPEKLFGLLITVFAISLGAPFWFEVLNKLVSLRSAGQKETTALISTPKVGEASATPTDGGKPSGLTLVAPLAELKAVTATSRQTASPAVTWSPRAMADDLKGFDPTADGYADANALALARMSLLAYKDLAVAESMLTNGLGFNSFRPFANGTTQAFVAGSPAAVIVAFRGTEPSEIEDIVTDANFPLKDRPGSTGRIHAGFAAGLALVAAQIKEAVEKIAREPSQVSGRAPTIWVTGHSLGAALATLFSLELEEARLRVAGLYTFGSPRVGDDAFAATFERYQLTQRAFRFVNHEDLVTRMPPRTFGYQHVGTLKYFDEDGLLQSDSKWWTRFLNTTLDALSDFKTAAKTTVKDHSMELYVQKLENWTARTA